MTIIRTAIIIARSNRNTTPPTAPPTAPMRTLEPSSEREGERGGEGGEERGEERGGGKRKWIRLHTLHMHVCIPACMCPENITMATLTNFNMSN